MSQFSSSDDQPLEEQDVRDLIRLPGRVIAAKADQTGKRRLIMEGLCQLIGADAGACSLLHLKLGSAPRQVVFLHEGITDDRLPHYLRSLEHEDLQWIRNRLVVDAVTRRQPLTRRDRQLFSEWPEESIAFRTGVANPHFSYRFCCELPPSAPCGLLCEQAVSASLRLLRPAPASFRPEFPLDSMFSCSSAGTARREIRSAR